MTRSSWRHSNERLIDRIVNGDTQIVADDGREPDVDWEADEQQLATTEVTE